MSIWFENTLPFFFFFFLFCCRQVISSTNNSAFCLKFKKEERKSNLEPLMHRQTEKPISAPNSSSRLSHHIWIWRRNSEVLNDYCILKEPKVNEVWWLSNYFKYFNMFLSMNQLLLIILLNKASIQYLSKLFCE